jgi:adenosylcobinamide-phosphate synthase
MHFFDIERIPLAITAIFISCIMGIALHKTIRSANPPLWWVIDLVFGTLGDKLDRRQRPRADLVFRGFLLTICMSALFYAGIKAAAWIIASYPYYGLTEILILAITLSSGSIWAMLINLYQATENKKNSNQEACYTLTQSARLDVSKADTHTIARAAISLAAQNWSRTMIAPVLFYLCLGLPAAIMFSLVAGIAWRFGKQGFSKGFGEFPIAMEWLAGIIPSFIAALFLMIAVLFTPKARKIFGLSIASYAQGGLPVSITAHALNISLGGAYKDVSGSAIKGKWIGPKKATAKNDRSHLWRAAYMLIIAHILLILALIMTYLLASDFSLAFMLDFLR